MMRVFMLLLLATFALTACGIDGEPLTPPAKSTT